jgi:hypothetical protein
LVIVPILAGAVGPFSVWAMLAVCALAYAVGHVIRFNIQFAEPALASENPPKRLKFTEGSSDIALVGAYVISVCLYINILASFLLGGLNNVWSGIDTPFHELLLTAGVIAVIGPLHQRGPAFGRCTSSQLAGSHSAQEQARLVCNNEGTDGRSSN